jgi:hypothetical protein
MGVFLIFTSAVFNAGKTFSDFAYVYDIFSTAGIVLIFIGAAKSIKN